MRFQLDDHSIVNTDKAQMYWGEARDWNGNNHISRATHSQWEHETLYRSSRGRYYIVSISQWEGTLPSARQVNEQEATRWLLLNEHELPADLANFEKEVEE